MEREPFADLMRHLPASIITKMATLSPPAMTALLSHDGGHQAEQVVLSNLTRFHSDVTTTNTFLKQCLESEQSFDQLKSFITRHPKIKSKMASILRQAKGGFDCGILKEDEETTIIIDWFVWIWLMG